MFEELQPIQQELAIIKEELSKLAAMITHWSNESKENRTDIKYMEYDIRSLEKRINKIESNS